MHARRNASARAVDCTLLIDLAPSQLPCSELRNASACNRHRVGHTPCVYRGGGCRRTWELTCAHAPYQGSEDSLCTALRLFYPIAPTGDAL